MAKEGSDYRQFEEKGLLLPNSATYNAFHEEARAIFWKQCEEDWFSAGVDAWWCDNSEPFSDADWNGETKRGEALRYQIVTEDSKKSMDWTRLNTYGLLHAKGIYDNWRETNSEKRVANLTRSAYISGQRYGVICWSGDVCAKWSTLRQQIAEGIKFSMSGMPYWTNDIGGFFTVKDKWENRGCGKAGDATPLWFWNGDFNDGADDLGYRELYVRWLQYGTFLPMFRAHGTDTPREPWRFGKPGEIFYDAILKFIRLRYRLLPYIYATAAAVSQRQDTMLRSLMFDFPEDENVKEICDSYLFGRAMLVCPVTEPMDYGANSALLPHREKRRSVYLPQSCVWYDFWTNQAYAGGQTIACEAPLDSIPLFIRAGSILPMSAPLMYADQMNGQVSEILVYDGADGEFTLYNDEGDHYSYEKGHFSAIPLIYRHQEKTIVFGKAQGTFKHQERFTVKRIGDGQMLSIADVHYRGEETAIRLA
jgi:alpha-D-xyloside xylohydrolase